jgi:hypothetical protein
MLERFKRGNSNKSARTCRKKKEARTDTAARTTRSSSVPPDHERQKVQMLPKRDSNLPMRDSKGFTIAKNGPGNVVLQIRHDIPTLGLGDAAYQRAHQTHRMNGEQYEQLQRQLGHRQRQEQRQRQQQQQQQDGQWQQQEHRHWQQRRWVVEEDQIQIEEPARGVVTLGLPDNLRPGSLFRKRNKAAAEQNNNSCSGIEHNRQKSLPRKSKIPSSYENRPVSAHGNLVRSQQQQPQEPPHFYSTLKKSDSFSSGRGSESTSCSSDLEPLALTSAAPVSTFVPPNRGRPPSYLLPKSFSPCPPTKMHPFIPNLGVLRQNQGRISRQRRKLAFSGEFLSFLSFLETSAARVLEWHQNWFGLSRPPKSSG